MMRTADLKKVSRSPHRANLW